MDLDFGGLEPEECDGLDPEMTIGELMEWRYFKAERSKELVCSIHFARLPLPAENSHRVINHSEIPTTPLPSSIIRLLMRSILSFPITS